MTSSPQWSPEVQEAFDYARGYYTGDQEVIDDYELLARYRPEVFAGYIGLRRAAFNTGAGAALSPKVKELVILAIELARTKVNEPPAGHAKWAVEAGATPAEVAEVASLCILIGGMLTYQESGRFALREAEERCRPGSAGPATSDDKIKAVDAQDACTNEYIDKLAGMGFQKALGVEGY